MSSPVRILLIIGGGIAAYKSLELIRALKKRGDEVNVILTKAGEEFVTKLSVGALSGNDVRGDLFDADQEQKMGHIELTRAADLAVVAPATADLLAKLANGLANDLASTALLATDKHVLLAPAMNVRMWEHSATQRNVMQLKRDGHLFVGPAEGDMACGEYGMGRMAEVDEILDTIDAALGTESTAKPLAGRHIIVTSGPTYEPIDPVRYLANRSSGKQGHAIAQAIVNAGARVTLISGPTHVQPPKGARFIGVETAEDMFKAVMAALPADVFIGVAAVADWRASDIKNTKIKKIAGGNEVLALAENPDILASVSQHRLRPQLVIGFAAETGDTIEEAKAKRARKGCDWLLANDVSQGEVFGADENEIHFITENTTDHWSRALKTQIAERLVSQIASALN